MLSQLRAICMHKVQAHQSASYGGRGEHLTVLQQLSSATQDDSSTHRKDGHRDSEWDEELVVLVRLDGCNYLIFGGGKERKDLRRQGRQLLNSVQQLDTVPAQASNLALEHKMECRTTIYSRLWQGLQAGSSPYPAPPRTPCRPGTSGVSTPPHSTLQQGLQPGY